MEIGKSIKALSTEVIPFVVLRFFLCFSFFFIKCYTWLSVVIISCKFCKIFHSHLRNEDFSQRKNLTFFINISIYSRYGIGEQKRLLIPFKFNLSVWNKGENFNFSFMNLCKIWEAATQHVNTWVRLGDGYGWNGNPTNCKQLIAGFNWKYISRLLRLQLKSLHMLSNNNCIGHVHVHKPRQRCFSQNFLSCLPRHVPNIWPIFVWTITFCFTHSLL